MKRERKVKNRFENWYFRLVDSTKEHVLGVLVGKRQLANECEAFIQIIGEEERGENIYLSYPIEAARSLPNGMQIEDNIFTTERIEVRLKRDVYRLEGEVLLTHPVPLKKSLWIPGLMGPFKYMPFLDSYHEVVSLNNTLSGSLKVNEETILLNEGKGYIKKDWGKSYPNVWIWAQCSHFKKVDLAIMIGVARLPLFMEYYTSFSIPILRGNQVEVFSSYNGGHLTKLYRYKGYIHLVVMQKRKILDIKIYGEDEASCQMSKNIHMIRDVYVCNRAKMEVSLLEDNQLIFEDVGYCCDLEMGGNTSKLK